MTPTKQSLSPSSFNYNSLIPFILLAFGYLSLYWIAGDAMVYILLVIFSILWILPIGFFILVIWFLSNYFSKNKKSSSLKKAFLMYCEFIVLIIIGIRVIGPLSIKMYHAENDKYNQEMADQTVEALRKYHQDNNSYPKTLNELVPKYMSKAPRTKTNEEFRYLGGNDINYLMYPDKDTGMCYKGKWESCEFPI